MGGVPVGVEVWLGVPRVRHRGGSCGGREWPFGVVGASLSVRVGELASEGREVEGGLTWAGG